jgi:dephospho-CoA kinase
VLKIALTGGLATGKSTVAARLAELGATVFDADRIVDELYAPGGPGTRAAGEIFGEGILAPGGRPDRSRIAAIVFADPSKLRALEARIHPLVRAEIRRRFAEAEGQGAPVAVAEASQILESGSEGDYDRTLLVVAPEAERLRRWELSGGSREDARRRIAAQIPPEEAVLRATDVLVNDGSPSELRRRVDEIYRRWIEGNRTGS